MKKIVTILAIFSLLSAKSFIISPIPMPDSIILDISITKYSKEELLDFLKKGKVFSFLSQAKNYQDNQQFSKKFKMVAKEVGIIGNFPFRIALLSPTKKIGKYTLFIQKSIISYLLYKNANFYFETFILNDENLSTIKESLNNIEQKEFDLIVAPLTEKGAKNIINTSTFTAIFIPTVNSSFINSETIPKNILFGGIDYKKQIEELTEFGAEKISLFYDTNSPLTIKLNNYIDQYSFVEKKIGIKRESTRPVNAITTFLPTDEASVETNQFITVSGCIRSFFCLYDLSDLCRQYFCCKGFLYERDSILQHINIIDDIPAVAGHANDTNTGKLATYMLSQLITIHAGHHHIS